MHRAQELSQVFILDLEQIATILHFRKVSLKLYESRRSVGSVI